MPVISNSLALHWTGATGSVTREPLREEYTAVWRLRTDNPQEQARSILIWFAANVAPLGSDYQYADDPAATARLEKLDANRAPGSVDTWLVVGRYVTPEDEEGEDKNGNPTSDPLEFRPHIEVADAQYTKPAHRSQYAGGYHGTAHNFLLPLFDWNAPVNSALQPFNPAAEMDDSRQIVTIRRNWTVCPADDAEQWMNSVNQLEITIQAFGFLKRIPPHCGRIRGFRGSLARQNSQDFWQLSLSVDCRRDSWVEPILDQGIHARAFDGDPDGNGGSYSPGTRPPGVPQVRRLLGRNQAPIVDPVLLDGDGQPLDPEGTGKLDPVFGQWLHYERRVWQAFFMFFGIAS
jgi:hypothetical protein